MLAETMHRTFNDLSCVIGSLNIARRQLDPEHRPGLDAVIRRVSGTADMQRLLGPPLNFGKVDLRERLEEVCRLFAATRLAGGTIGLKVHADACMLEAGTCWSVATVVAELVTNAAKHAFPGGVGEIAVRACDVGGSLIVLVADDGIGGKGAASAAASGKRLRRGIVDDLVAACGGSLRSIPTPVGTTVEFSLPLGRSGRDPVARRGWL